MSQPQPVIDGFEFASAGRSLRGVLPIRDFPRLHDLLAADDGEVAYEIDGLRDEHGRPSLRVRAQGTLQLRCQRCLEALPCEMRADEVLVLAGSQAEIDAEPEDVHGADRVVATKEMPVRELIEDELILALPYAPRHAGCSAGAAQAGAGAAQTGAGAAQGAVDRSLPFAGLRGLIRGKH